MRWRWRIFSLGCVLIFTILGCGRLRPSDDEGEIGISSDTGTGVEGEDTDQLLLDEVFKDPSEDEAAALFDPFRVAEIRLSLPPDEWEQLLINARDEIYVPADIEIDKETVGEVGLRFKGSYGTLYGCFEEDEFVCPKLSMKIKFSEYDVKKRYKGLKRLNLHAMHHDHSLVMEYVA